MFKLADLIEKNTDELAKLEALNNGKTFATAKAADIPITVKTFRYYAGWCDKI
jgi:aldehyde dehydrogenase (NAD+)